jgi:hypothetical protein
VGDHYSPERCRQFAPNRPGAKHPKAQTRAHRSAARPRSAGARRRGLRCRSSVPTASGSVGAIGVRRGGRRWGTSWEARSGRSAGSDQGPAYALEPHTLPGGIAARVLPRVDAPPDRTEAFGRRDGGPTRGERDRESSSRPASRSAVCASEEPKRRSLALVHRRRRAPSNDGFAPASNTTTRTSLSTPFTNRVRLEPYW